MKKFYLLIALFMLVGRMSAQNPVKYCVENEITHGYLNDFTYDTIADLNVSYVMEYFNKPHEYRLDAPVPAHLSWTHQDGADAQRVEVSEQNTYANPIVFTINKDAAEYDLYNLIPGKTYYYRIVSVKAGAETAVSTGVLEPSGMLRWLLVDGTWNVRDMGGWPGLGGHAIKYGQLFRGGQLTNPNSPYSVLITSAGKEAMRNAGIRAELDLRSDKQAHYSTASFADNSYAADFTNIATTSARMWKFDADNSNIKAIQWVIDELKAGKPVFYHCQNGADRTGTIGLLIGALLGMSDGDLAKDYELTTFCQAAAVKFDSSEKGFARLRNYEGKYGSEDKSSDPKDYMFAPVIDKLKTYKTGYNTTQRKIYEFLKEGKSGTKISEEDLDWFIKEMVDYVLIKTIKCDCADKIELNPGETKKVTVSFTPANANGAVSFKSSNPAVATVSETGLITAVRGGEAIITFGADGITQKVTVNVPTVESTVPAYALYNGANCNLTGNNRISNGSFEYGSPYYYWTNAKGGDMTAAYFDIKHYENSDSVYLESKVGGDAKSEGSIRNEWKVGKNKNFIFGYRVKNSTDLATVNNENFKVMLTTLGSTDESGAQILKFPSYNSGRTSTMQYPCYDGNWTEIQYVFNSGDHNSLRIVFTNLSADGNNTCLDNFYLAEIDITAGIRSAASEGAHSEIYDLTGRKVGEGASGILIRDGKKILSR